MFVGRFVRRAVPVLSTTALFVGSGLVAPGTALAAPAGWTAPQGIPGTVGQANPVSSTAPNGTDLVVWINPGSTSGAQIKARIRLAGRSTWQRVPARVDNEPSVQDMVLAPTSGGDFWLSWVQYAGQPEVYAMRLDSRTRRWSKPTPVFHQPGYGHGGPSLAVAGNGTIVIAAYAPPDTPTTPPTYRVVVATRSPGGAWRTHFLSPASQHAGGEAVAVNSSGQVLVSFIQGYNLSEMTVMAATRSAKPSATWHVHRLSKVGDSQRAHPALGDDGTAAVAWSATSTSFDAVRLSTAHLGHGTPAWTRRNVATGVPSVVDAYPVVTKDGQTTTVWTRSSSGQQVLWSRNLIGTSLGAPLQLSPDGMTAVVDAFKLRADGKAALMYQLFSNGPLTNQGLRLRVLRHGVSGPAVDLTESSDGSVNSPALGVDAASRSTVIWTRGDYPGTDFAWLGQVVAKPSVMSGPSSGHLVRRASVTGVARVGKTVTCASGYWVETSGLDYRWLRNGSRIHGADGPRYRLVGADSHRRISCRVTASNFSGIDHVLRSRTRRVR